MPIRLFIVANEHKASFKVCLKYFCNCFFSFSYNSFLASAFSRIYLDKHTLLFKLSIFTLNRRQRLALDDILNYTNTVVDLRNQIGDDSHELLRLIFHLNAK